MIPLLDHSSIYEAFWVSKVRVRSETTKHSVRRFFIVVFRGFMIFISNKICYL